MKGMKIEFTKDFANKEKGEIGVYDSLLSSQLVNVDRVAKYVFKPIDLNDSELEAFDSLSKKESIKAENAAKEGNRTLLDKILGLIKS